MHTVADKTPLELSLEHAQYRVALEYQRQNSLDTKATMVLGFLGVLSGLIFDATIGFIADNSSTNPLLPLPQLVSIFLGLAFMGLIICTMTTLLSLRLRENPMGIGGKRLDVLKDTPENDPKSVQDELFNSFVGAIDVIRENNKNKANYLYASFLSLGSTIILIFLALAALAIDKKVLTL